MAKQLPAIAFLTIIIFTISLTSAICTLTLDKTEYAPTESASAEIICTSNNQRNDAYTVNWTYENGTEVESDSGTTPNAINEHFYETYTIPSTWPTGVFLNATLEGTDLDGATDSANISNATTNSLIFSNEVVGGMWLGLTTSVKAIVKDENGKEVSGGSCRYSVWSNDGTQMLHSGTEAMFSGQVKFEWILEYTSFAELTDYAILLSCYCGSTGSITECIDEDGTAVTNSVGSATAPFTTNEWVSINEAPFQITYENGTEYPSASVYAGFGEEVYYEANVTNNYNGSTLETRGTQYLVNSITGEIFGEIEGVETSRRSLSEGDNIIIVRFRIPTEVPTGTYYINNFINIYYNNLLVSQGTVPTETFTVTGTDDSFRLSNVDIDKSSYYTGENLHICANITNSYEKRVEFDIFYNYRCGTDNLDSSTERTLLGEHTERRAIGSGISQYQCAEMTIPFEDHLMYQESGCYASVTIQSPYIDTFDNKISTASSVFTVIDYGMYPEYELDPRYPLVRLFPDWKRFDDLIDGVSRSYFRAKINITELNETKIDPDDKIGDADWDIYVLFTDSMPCSNELYNYTAEYANGSTINNPVEIKEMQWKNIGEEMKEKCAIGVEEINFSDTDDDYFIVKIWYEDFEERSTKALEASQAALEGIENKTGTFHLDVQCPSTTEPGDDMDCSITAQIEDDQVVQKEVDFTCYITGDGNIYSSVNFNQMINRTAITLSQTFPVPSTLTRGTQYTLQCHADYYNFGSRRDSFYDTFTAGTSATGASTSGGGWVPIDGEEDEGEMGVSPITGRAIDGSFEGPLKDNTYVIVTTFAALVILLIAIVLLSHKRKDYHHKTIHTKNKKSLGTKEIIWVSVASLAGLGLLLWLGKYLLHGISRLWVFFSTANVIEDPLFRNMLLVTFIALVTVAVFKALKIKIDISIGRENPIEKYWKQKHKD